MERRRRLIQVPSSAEVMRRLVDEAASAAKSALFQPTWKPADDQPGYYRVEAKIPLADETFDQLFNGRSGYRASYYLSPTRGAAFNQAIVRSLVPAILRASAGFAPDKIKLIERSLIGRYSKIWVVGDGQVFLDSPPALIPERWAAYWKGKDSALGLRLPLPPAPQLDLKGTFIDPATGAEWVYEGKLDRDNDIHRSGWT